MVKKDARQVEGRKNGVEKEAKGKSARKAATGPSSSSTTLLAAVSGAVVLAVVSYIVAPASKPKDTWDGRDFRVLPIKRVAKADMSKDLFWSEYSTQKPVVITGAWPESGWRPAEIVSACPQARIRTFRYDENSQTWARHVQVGEVPLPEYFAKHWEPPVAKRPQPLIYGFEMELKKHCPKQLESVKIPAFLSEDVFHIVTNNTGLGWPSVLFGPAGSITGLHIDTHQLPFWISVISPEGKSGKSLKRVRVFSHTDVNILRYGQSTAQSNMVFSFDPWKPDFLKYKEIARSIVYEAELRSGELLYIPGGSPHAVINIDDNVGVSMNFLDLKTFPNFARKCNSKSPLCGLVAGKGAQILSALDKQRAKVNDQSYWEFADIADKADFCRVHAGSTGGEELPALKAYCE